MKTLYIIRHAKSDWDDKALSDHDRPLSSRGLRDAPVMASRFLHRSRQPEFVLSSTALRALTTCKIFCDAWQIAHGNIHIDKEFYFGSMPAMIRSIEEALAMHDTVAVFGHNPNSSILANYWCSDFHHDIPTCAIVAIRFEKLVGADLGTLLWYDFPKNSVK